VAIFQRGRDGDGCLGRSARFVTVEGQADLARGLRQKLVDRYRKQLPAELLDAVGIENK